MANALAGLGIKSGDRVATLAWNGYRHMEIYYAASGSGAVLHTLNPRLHPDQVVYIADHAEDRALFFDLTFLPLDRGDRAPRQDDQDVRRDDRPRAHMPADSKIPNLLCYEDCSPRRAATRSTWPTFDESQASSLCYTSGTTATRRAFSTAIARRCCTPFAIALPDALNCSARTSILPGGADVPRQRVGPAVRRPA
jgi:fatty-acyl-CoA synthase